MYRSPPVGGWSGGRKPPERRGIILLVVLFLLTLFAIAGLSFVLYADAEAAAARLHRDALTLAEVPDMDPELAFSYFLGQLIYDVADNESGVYSALRGHSLARLMYGLNYDINPNGTFNYAGKNTVPFIGTGRLHTDSNLFQPGGPLAQQPGGPNNPFGLDDYFLINYTYYKADGFLRDPERLGALVTQGGRQVYSAYRTDLYDTTQRPGPYVGGFNVPYTYPDLNNMFLAHVRTADGRVTLPSFHRPWLFGPLDPGNPNWWANSSGKYLLLRPRPVDQLTQADVTAAGLPWPLRPETLNSAQQQTLQNLIGNLQRQGRLFPYPDDADGDVKNLVTAPGGNDSLWIDIGAPVLTLPGGKKYKMLVAPLIIDLDGRLNVSMHGNLMGPNRAHASNQGWGPWEINLGRVLTGGGGSEWKNLFLGTQTATPRLWGKYGANQIPTNVSTASGVRAPHYYAQIDYNGARESALATPVAGERLRLPGDGGANPLSCFPGFPNGRYNNAGTVERREHAKEYNAFRAVTYVATNDDRVFAAANMAALLRFNDTGSEALTSELLRLCPDNFATGPNADRLRRLVTTHSFDINQAGVTPYAYNVAGSPSYAAQPGNPTGAPVGAALPFPPLDWRVNPPPGFLGAHPYGEFRPNDWRAQLERTLAEADVGRIDLNRSLARYPHYAARVSYDGRFDGFDPTAPPPPPPPPTPPLPVPTVFTNAFAARHIFVDNIYRRLLAVTGVPPVQNPVRPTDEELVPRRWLAQLAVNIVDYLDEDDISTAFNFYTEDDAYPQGRPATAPPFDIGELGRRNPKDPEPDPELPRYWVFGTELPKVVVNEVLVEHRIPAEPAAGSIYPVHVWVELHNPMQVVPSGLSLVAQDGLPIRFRVDPLPAGLTSAAVPVGPQSAREFFPYRVVVANRLLPRPGNDNVLGTPDVIRTQTNDQDFTRPRDFDRPSNRINGQAQPNRNIGSGATATTVRSPYIDSQGGPSGSAFFLIGPADEQGRGIDDARGTIKAVSQGGRVPNNTPYLRAPNLKYDVRINGERQPVPDDRPTGLTVLLRRLANPHIPPNNERAVRTTRVVNGQEVEVLVPNPWYNPYVTVDYLEANPLNDATNPDNIYASRGKRQPYAAFLKRAAPDALAPAPDSPVVDQELTAPPALPTTPPRTLHNFGQPNTPIPLAEHYEWLVHLDRELISAPEILHVSAYAPHLLTQRFIVGDDRDPANKFRHYAPWFDQGPLPWSSPGLAAGTSHRLYRLFEHLQCYDRIAGVGSAEAVRRVPGKININSVWDEEIFQALCDAAAPNDPNNPNYFHAGHVQEIFNQMMARRSPGDPARGIPPGTTPTQNDRPFLSIAAGLSPPCQQYPKGLGGIEETILASFNGAGGRRLLQPPLSVAVGDPANHPYLQMQLLTKIFDNLTTRSNVFAVWATVGFFEVIDDAARPMKLGAELGRAEGRHVRHRMFAIIDRSQILAPSTGTAAGPVPQPRFNPSGNLVLVPYFGLIK